MDYDKVSGPELGHALRAISVNLLCRDVMAEVAFLTKVFGMTAHQAGRDFAILLHACQPLQLHSGGAFTGHPLISLLPEAGARGAGLEIRLHEADPDQAAERAEAAGGVVLQVPTDKKGHSLREAVILSPSGYAFVPSRRI